MAGTPVEVAVLRTGSANLASVLAALRRLGAAPSVTRDPEVVERSPRLVVPGVGTLAAAMSVLSAEALVAPLKGRIASGRPTLAICLGMQLLGAGSEESPGVEGLGVFPGRSTRFPAKTDMPRSDRCCGHFWTWSSPRTCGSRTGTSAPRSFCLGSLRGGLASSSVNTARR